LTAWKKLPEGKELVSQDDKIKREKNALNRLKVLKCISGIASIEDNSPNQDFLEEITTFIDGVGNCGLRDVDDGFAKSDVDNIEEITPAAMTSSDVSDLEKGIEKVKPNIKQSQKICKSLKAKRVKLLMTH